MWFCDDVQYREDWRADRNGRRCIYGNQLRQQEHVVLVRHFLFLECILRGFFRDSPGSNQYSSCFEWGKSPCGEKLQMQYGITCRRLLACFMISWDYGIFLTRALWYEVSDVSFFVRNYKYFFFIFKVLSRVRGQSRSIKLIYCLAIHGADQNGSFFNIEIAWGSTDIHLLHAPRDSQNSSSEYNNSLKRSEKETRNLDSSAFHRWIPIHQLLRVRCLLIHASRE